MTTVGDINYFENLTEEDLYKNRKHPFFPKSRCGFYLMQIGAIIDLLPEPPAKLLDLGCGTGWTSRFFAKIGYSVTGVDISYGAIDFANQQKLKEEIENLEFLVLDFENLNYTNEYDCAVFFSSLHHASNEKEAIQAAYTALKPGGILITLEPGEGHEVSKDTLEEIKKYKCTEKDMPPKKIIEIGNEIGFSKAKFYPVVKVIEPKNINKIPSNSFIDLKKIIINYLFFKNLKSLIKNCLLRKLHTKSTFFSLEFYNSNDMGIVLLQK